MSAVDEAAACCEFIDLCPQSSDVSCAEQARRRSTQATEAAALRRVAMDIKALRETAWKRYISGPGGKTEALRQGRVDGLDAALAVIRTALTPASPPHPQPPACGANEEKR